MTKQPDPAALAAEVVRVQRTLELAAAEISRTSRSTLWYDLIPVYQLAVADRIARALEQLGTYVAGGSMLQMLERATGGTLGDLLSKAARKREGEGG